MSIITRYSSYVLDDEGDLAAAQYAGELVNVATDGTVTPADEDATPATIIEVPLTPDLDETDQIPAGERVDLAHLTNGVEAFTRAGEAIAEDDLLVVNASGRVVPYDSANDSAAEIIGRAYGSAAADGDLVNVRYF